MIQAGTLYSQHTAEPSLHTDTLPPYRDYHVLVAPNHDIYNASINTRTGGKLLHDAFTRGIGPQIGNTTVRNITEGVWSFATIFSAMLWSHEFGHMLRARQVGGRFYIERYSFPVIHGRMELPANHSLQDNALSITGGFEANYLTVRDIQLDLYRYNSLYNDELSLAFAHRLLYPIYFSLIAPVDPALPETWTNTMGDPVHWIKPIWQRAGKDVLMADGTVNAELVRFYKQSALASVLWNLADLNVYREAGALFGNTLEGKKARYLFGNSSNGWGYGTHFNTSVLGAELNLVNYLRFNDKLYTTSLRYGFPFENYGIGLGAYHLLNTTRYNMDLNLDVWSQAYYGKGFALSSNLYYNLHKPLDLVLQAGYKTEGYVLGRMIDRGFIGHIGMRFVMGR